MANAEKIYETPTGLARVTLPGVIAIFIGGFVVLIGGFFLSVKLMMVSLVTLGIVTFFVGVGGGLVMLVLPDHISRKQAAAWMPCGEPVRIVDIVTITRTHAANPAENETITQIVFEKAGTWTLVGSLNGITINDQVTDEYLSGQRLVRNLTKV